MTPKRLRPTTLFESDLVRAAEFLDELGGDPDRLLARVFRTAERLASPPGTGSPRVGAQLGVDGLRSVPIRQELWAIFYVVTKTEVVLLRLLHQARDLNPSFFTVPKRR